MAGWSLGTNGHSWQSTAQGGTSIMRKTILAAGETLALTAIQFIENPALCKEAREELMSVTGGKHNPTVPADLDPQKPYPQRVLPD